MSKKNKLLLSLICNFLIIVTTIGDISYYFINGGDGNMMVKGVLCLRFFTNLSNILVALCSLVLVIFTINKLKKNKKIPDLVYLLKYIGTVSVSVTFITCVVFLGPIQQINGLGYFSLFKGNVFFLNFFTPLISILSYIILEKNNLKKNTVLYSLLPTIFYGIVYFIMVMITKSWPDFYNFTFGGKYYLAPVSFITMIFATYGIGYALRKLNKK